MIQIQHPKVLLAILAIVPAAFFVFFHFKKLSRTVLGFYGKDKNFKIYKNLRVRLFLKIFFRSLSWICAVLAFAGISWGSRNIPVPKNGSTVCFVFDISWSMTAADCPGNLSRLDAAKIYAANLLPLVPQSSFSAVLAKGDGFEAIPETDDISSVLSLIANLNPNLVSAPGSSIGKGIHAALNSLPLNSAKLNYIWVFTDGDETDSNLKNALEEACSKGVPVTLVGFGSEKESEVLTGDGKTKAKTALRAEKMRNLAAEAQKKGFPSFRNSEKDDLIRYVSANENGSAYFLAGQVKPRNISGNDGDFLTYEVVPVKRHGFFIVLSIVFLVLSFVAEELNFPADNKPESRKKKKSVSAVLLCFFLFPMIFCSCGFKNQKEILKGSWNFYQENYRKAMADFLNAAVSNQEEKSKDDSMAHQYALFDLSSTYIAVGEFDSALDRISQMSVGTPSVPKELESAAYYNAGIIFERKNDFIQAAEYFKKAILSNPEYLDAKINLEFCERHLEEKNAQEAETEMQKVSENNENFSQMQNEIFNIIKENENRQWKKMQSSPKESSVLDY